MDDLAQKLEALRKKYPDQESNDLLSSYEKSAKQAILTSNLKNHDGIKILLKGYEDEIARIDKELSNNHLLFKDQEGNTLGRLLHERKNWCKKFINIFRNAELIKQGVENHVDELLQG